MSIVTNRLLFSHSYLDRLQADSQVDEMAAATAQGVRDWHAYRDKSSTKRLIDTWVAPILQILEFDLKAPVPEADQVYLLYPAWGAEAPVGLCYIAPPGCDLDNTTKGTHWMAEAVLAARAYGKSAEEPPSMAESSKGGAIRWVILTNGDQWRLLDSTALRRYEAFVQVDLDALSRHQNDLSALRVFYRCFHRTAFQHAHEPGVSLDSLLSESQGATAQAEGHIKDRVSDSEGIMAQLCLGLVKSTGKSSFTQEERDAIYRDATYLLYRMLFLLYAEAQGLLPMDNPSYAAGSLTNLAQTAYQYQLKGMPDPEAVTLWQSLRRLSTAIYESDEQLGIPAYNGGLFDNDDKPYLREGSIADTYLSKALFDLAFMPDPTASLGGAGGYGRYVPIDYRDLSVRHLGSLFEGMIEYKLFVVEEPMVARRDAKGAIQYLKQSEAAPLKRSDHLMKTDEVYFAQSPGERRGTGTYYTPEYVVDYIVSRTVGCGLSERRKPLEARLSKWLHEVLSTGNKDERERMERSVDHVLYRFAEQDVLTFRVCDPAMGSGHFLVNAAHQITNFIVETLHLTDWRNDELDTDPVAWRRRVAEHCLYGVDLSQMAVELAKLSLWIATISLDKPLSFLDHHLRHGNSLVGANVEQLDEALNAGGKVTLTRREAKQVAQGQSTMLTDPTFSKHFTAATNLMSRIASTVANAVSDVKIQEADYEQLRVELAPYRALANLMVARYFGLMINNADLLSLYDSLTQEHGAGSDDGQDVLQKGQALALELQLFHWGLEYPDVFPGPGVQGSTSTPGFDVVVGNPPWGGRIHRELSYFHANYPATTQEHTDSFKLFIDRGLQLVAAGGVLSLIVPNALLRQKRFRDVRAIMLESQIIELVDLGEDVFPGVVTPTCIFVLGKRPYNRGQKVQVSDLSKHEIHTKPRLLQAALRSATLVDQFRFLDNPDLEFQSLKQSSSAPTIPLGSLSELQCKDAGINYQRVKVGMHEKGKGDLADRLLYEGERQRPEDQMYWKGSDLQRYWISETTVRFCRPDYRDFVEPNEKVHLNTDVYALKPKILLRQTADRIIAALDYNGIWFGRSIIAIVPTKDISHAPEYFLGLLNSRYLRWQYGQLVQEENRVFAQVKLSKIKQLPIRTIDFSAEADANLHNRMVLLVGHIQSLRKLSTTAVASEHRAAIEAQIEIVEQQIDDLVYELYGLTDEEIALVEQSIQGHNE